MLKLYKIYYDDGRWHTGSLEYELIAVENVEEARAIAKSRTDERNRVFKTCTSFVGEITLDGYEIIVKKKE